MTKPSTHSGVFSGPSSIPIQDIPEPKHECQFPVCLHCQPFAFFYLFNNFFDPFLCWDLEYKGEQNRFWTYLHRTYSLIEDIIWGPSEKWK